MEETIRLLVVDDHAVVRSGLVALLGTVAWLQVVAQAADANSAVEQFLQHSPDVTLMDLRLGGTSGVDAIQRIRVSNPNARIIVLTTFDGDEDIFRALEAGAKGYLLKGMSVDDLLAAIRDVHRGKSSISSEIAGKLVSRMSGQQLTAREQNVLECVVGGRSNKQIGSDLGISEATVKTHINSLLGKLGVEDRTQAATVAIQRGLVHLGSR